LFFRVLGIVEIADIVMDTSVGGFEGNKGMLY